MSYWKDKCVIVTGATSGIGRNLVLNLLDMGARVGFCGRSEEKMSNLLNEIKVKEKAEFYYETFEITEENKITSFINNAANKLGTVDVLINCAGANTARGAVKDIKIEDFDYMFKLNTLAPLMFIKQCYKYMEEKREGLIVNILTTCCLFSNENLGAYTASKTALDSLTKVLRKEARKDNIRVCSVYPGGVNTSFREVAKEGYLNSNDTAVSILKALDIDKSVAIDEIVLRPIIETNYY